MGHVTSQSFHERPNVSLDVISQPSGGKYHSFKPIPEGVFGVAGCGELIDRYLDEEIGICLHLHARQESFKLKSCDQVFVFQKARSANFHPLESYSGWESEFGRGFDRPRTNQVQTPMPVLSGPIVEDAKRAIDIEDEQIVSEFGSVVRLYSFDDIPTILGEWCDLVSVISEVAAIPMNRKLEIPGIRRRVLSGVKDCGVVNHIVERRPKLVHEFSEGKRETAGQCSFVGLEPHFPCPIVLHVEPKSIEFSVAQGVPGIRQDVAVSFCAFDAIPRIIEWEE